MLLLLLVEVVEVTLVALDAPLAVVVHGGGGVRSQRSLDDDGRFDNIVHSKTTNKLSNGEEQNHKDYKDGALQKISYWYRIASSLAANEGSPARRERRRVGEGADVGRRRRLLVRRRCCRSGTTAGTPQTGQRSPPAPPRRRRRAAAAAGRARGDPASAPGPGRARRPWGAGPTGGAPRPATDQAVLVHLYRTLVSIVRPGERNTPEVMT